MKSETLNQLKKDSDKNNSIELKTALRIEYNSKIFYWKAQEKKQNSIQINIRLLF